ncbi:MAG: hypothetical protein B7Y55_13890 [Polynucleobacter sp. 35-46-207]|nr:MAG: hypothetical protein B7Y55_13890 [Polynucleobacter sp. 35-46-207]
MSKSLSMQLSRDHVKELIYAACSSCDKSSKYRLRVDVDFKGTVTWQLSALAALEEKVRIFWASDILPNPEDAIMHSGNVLLQHKVSARDAYDLAWQKAQSLGGFDALFINEKGFVTARDAYDLAWQKAQSLGGFDALFINEKGVVTEGGRSSIFIQAADGNQWLTPPLNAGVLPGVMRSIILGDPQRNAHEANLTINDVKNAKAIMLTNALRGVIPAYL